MAGSSYSSGATAGCGRRLPCVHARPLTEDPMTPVPPSNRRGPAACRRPCSTRFRSTPSSRHSCCWASGCRSTVAVQQTVSVYLLFYGLMSGARPAVGRVRPPPGDLGGLVLFIAASIGCALSRDLTTLLVFRALQGVTAGVGVIVGRAVIRDLYHGADAQRLMSGLDDLWHCAGDRADHRRLDPARRWRLAADLLVHGGVRAGAAGSDRQVAAGNPPGGSTHAAVHRALLRSYVQMGTNPRLLRGRGRCVQFLRHFPVHRLGTGVRDAAPATGRRWLCGCSFPPSAA